MKREKLTNIVTLRLNDEQCMHLESAAHNAGAKQIRDLTIETLANGFALKPNQRFLVAHLARIQYLVGIGFQMLADDRLSTEEWRKIRDFSKDSVDVITNRTLADFRSGTTDDGRATSSGR